MLKKPSLVKIDTLSAIFFFGTIFVALPFWPVCFGSSSSAVIVVQTGQSIAQAIDRASPGDIVYVKNGLYNESVIVVNKSLSVVGESPENTIIDGGRTIQAIFQIVADSVSLENFTLQNTSPDPFTQASAVRIHGATHVSLQNVTVRNSSVGFELHSSNLTEVSRCRISGCSIAGIQLRDNSCNNVVVGNTIANCSIGIRFADMASQGNKIYHNNFENNTEQVYSLGGTNYFDGGYPSGGNYWSDYLGVDLKSGSSQEQNGSDGIFDQGFSFDKYPLANLVTNVDIQISDREFHVQVSTNMNILGWNFDVPGKSLDILVTPEQDNTGAVRVQIPRDLLSSENLTDWIVSFQDNGSTTLQSIRMEDAENTYLYFTCSSTVEGEVQISGTKVFAELTPLTMTTFFLSLTILAAVLSKKRRLRRRVSPTDSELHPPP